MTCEPIKEKIDQLVFEQNDQAIAEVSHHIESCNSCRSYFEESIATKNALGLLQKEPDLRDPKNLTNTILASLDNIAQIPESNKNNNNPKIIRIIRRSLAAASVSLIIIFGIEQYILLDKITKLENQVAQVSNTQFQHILLYKSVQQINFYKKLITKPILNPVYSKLRTKLLLSRLSTIEFNEITYHNINNYEQTYRALLSEDSDTATSK